MPENKRKLEESRTPTESQSESTRLSDFLINAWLKFTRLVHCCLLFIKNAFVTYSQNFQANIQNKNWKITQACRFRLHFFGVLDFATEVKLGLKNLAMLPSYFEYIFVYVRQKARLRPELSPKLLSTLGQTQPKPNPKSPARLTTLLPSKIMWFFSTIFVYTIFCMYKKL